MLIIKAFLRKASSSEACEPIFTKTSYVLGGEHNTCDRKNVSTSNHDNKEKNIINMVFEDKIPFNILINAGFPISQMTGVDNVITFTEAGLEGVNLNYNEALVVSLEILDNVVRKVLIDNDSSVNIIFIHYLERLKLQGFRLTKYR